MSALADEKIDVGNEFIIYGRTKHTARIWENLLHAVNIGRSESVMIGLELNDGKSEPTYRDTVVFSVVRHLMPDIIHIRIRGDVALCLGCVKCHLIGFAAN